ncbi:MAG: hypothetical protein M1335_04990 [Chloroflexi bacterium]|nr:hypothetical protein [Chloroflexota bacterium]
MCRILRDIVVPCVTVTVPIGGLEELTKIVESMLSCAVLTKNKQKT